MNATTPALKCSCGANINMLVNLKVQSLSTFLCVSRNFFLTKGHYSLKALYTPLQTLGDLEGKAEEGNTLLEKQDLAAAHKVQFSTHGTQGTI